MNIFNKVCMNNKQLQVDVSNFVQYNFYTSFHDFSTKESRSPNLLLLNLIRPY